MVWLVAIACGIAGLSSAVQLLRGHDMRVAVALSPPYVALTALLALTASALSPVSHMSWRSAVLGSFSELASAAMIGQILGWTLMVSAGLVACACALRAALDGTRPRLLSLGILVLGAVSVVGVGYLEDDVEHALFVAAGSVGFGVLGGLCAQTLWDSEQRSVRSIGPAAAVLALLGMVIALSSQGLAEVLGLWTSLGAQDVSMARAAVSELSSGRDSMAAFALFATAAAVTTPADKRSTEKVLLALQTAGVVSGLVFVVGLWGLMLQPFTQDEALRTEHIALVADHLASAEPSPVLMPPTSAPLLRVSLDGLTVGGVAVDAAAPGPVFAEWMVPLGDNAPMAGFAVHPSAPWRDAYRLREAAVAAGAAELEWLVALPGGRVAAVSEKVRVWQSDEGIQRLPRLFLKEPEVTVFIGSRVKLVDDAMEVTLQCPDGPCVQLGLVDSQTLSDVLYKLRDADVDVVRVFGTPDVLSSAMLQAIVEVQRTGMAVSTSPRALLQEPDDNGAPSPLTRAGFTPDPPKIRRDSPPGLLEALMKAQAAGEPVAPEVPVVEEAPEPTPKVKEPPKVLDGDLL